MEVNVRREQTLMSVPYRIRDVTLMNKKRTEEGLDEIDRILLRLLSEEPRMSYSSIAKRLAAAGHEMSSEGVRNRVRKLLEMTSAFFLLAPEDHEWEILRIGLSLEDVTDAKSEVRSFLADTGFWLICDGMGTIDVYAVATSTSIADIDALLTSVRSHELVEDVDFSIETERVTDIENYFSHGTPTQSTEG